MTAPAIAGVPRSAIRTMIEREHERFAFANPRSRELAARSARHWLHGVPMHWMLDWGTPFPLFVAAAKGATFTDADGHGYADFCLGDTGAMFGHAPEPVADAVRRQTERGFTSMLPSEDAPIVGELLARRFGLPYWQTAVTATDANRFVMRLARWLTGRTKILVFNGCYHGTVDETFVRLKNGRPIHRPGLIGQAFDLTANHQGRRVQRRRRARSGAGARRCRLRPHRAGADQHRHGAAAAGLPRRPARGHAAHGTLLVIDETHTISTGPGGYTRAFDLAPDFFVLGKPIAGGIPCAVFGFTAEIAERLTKHGRRRSRATAASARRCPATRWRWRPCAPTSNR